MTEDARAIEKPRLDIAIIPIICAVFLIYAHSQTDAAFEYVQRQPFSALQEGGEPRVEHRLPTNTQKGLREIISELARVAGGYYDT